MLHRFPVITGQYAESERRLLHFAGPDNFIDNLAKEKNPSAESKDYNTRTENDPAVESLFNHFAEAGDITIDDLQDYAKERQKKGIMSKFDEDLARRLAIYLDPAADAAKRTGNEVALMKLIEYVNKRNALVQQKHKEVNALRQRISPAGPAAEQLSDPTKGPEIDAAKDVLGKSWDAFKKARGGDKLLIAGAAVIAFMVLAKATSSLFGEKKGIFGATKNLLLLGGSVYVGYKGLQALNRSYTLINGHPLSEDPMKTKEKWNEEKYAEQLQNITDAMRKNKLPESFMNRMDKLAGIDDPKKASAENNKFMKGVVNLSVLPVSDFVELYEESKKSGGIIPDDLWPQHPCPESREFPRLNLTPLERFQIMQEIGRSLGLIDDKGDPRMPADEKIASQTVLYLILDEQNASTLVTKDPHEKPAKPEKKKLEVRDIEVKNKTLKDFVDYLNQFSHVPVILEVLPLSDNPLITYTKKATAKEALSEVIDAINKDETDSNKKIALWADRKEMRVMPLSRAESLARSGGR